MRIFVALPLPNAFTKVLVRAQKPVDGIRWQPQHKMHITLKFLGEISEKKVCKLKKKLEKIEQSRFTLKSQSWGTFPQKGQPKVIWADAKPVDSIQQLRNRIENCYALPELQKNTYFFVPHITIGRIKGTYPRHKLEHLLDNFLTVEQEFDVKSFAIYESLPGRDKVIHKVIKKYPLPE